MDLLQIRDEMTRLVEIDYMHLSENDRNKIRNYFSIISSEFKVKLKKTDDSEILIDIIESNKRNDNINMDLMFLVYQRLIILKPQKDTLLGFTDYLGPLGPDWDEEVETIKELVSSNRISEAVEIALKIDYYDD